MLFQNYSISRKLTAAFAILILIAMVMGGIVYTQLVAIASANHNMTHHRAIASDMRDIRMDLSRMEAGMRGYLLTGESRYTNAMAKRLESITSRLAGLRQTAPERVAELDKITATVSAWHANVVTPAVAAIGTEGGLERALRLIRSDEADAWINAAEEAIDSVLATENDALTEGSATQLQAGVSATAALIIGTAVLILSTWAMGWLLSRLIAHPIATMTGTMRRLASGDKTVVVPGVDRKDEIGEMAGAVQVFKVQAVERERLEHEAQSSRASEAESARRQADLENAKAEDLRNFMGVVDHSFDRLSGGDLTVRMEGKVAPEFEPIRAKFNLSVEALEGAIGQVVSSVGSIRDGLGEITTASNDLAKRTEQQAASLEQTVAALGQVTNAVNETADGAGNAQKVADTARQKAEKGGDIVRKAVTAMSQIEASSNQINQIISVIDEIAFQTNLLALNAGVEAARAGEAGRGFAVVAQEVRGLAQRSAEAAKEIKSLIITSREQVGHGVEFVTASGQSLDEIVAEVTSMTQVIATIASSAREQATSLREVSTAADHMDRVTQQNAAMVEQSTAAAQILSQETDQLAATMAKFRTSDMGRPKTDPVRSRASATVQTHPARTPVAVQQLRTTGSGGAARKPAPMQAEESWEEF
ncbi:methyl-accepting chemotaxis protein [Fulvimarina sp. 2208YS6-2-32]|uniref:Methyl-accepting chemotaxis protein n=1 Tax=Fulvimarina uroteuthidis TaxID=3098149 RepID=A0ABU5I3C2_9HYPH|nr:methyl-accepting chemotaxis protein [Fulvimarina sp. 2208YS6-2-32]MDY8109843.1 methyl-accepting chemotaxis protein [Fulvimarina sp. 2208YS6-2-32]